jgi:hypothetical protein
LCGHRLQTAACRNMGNDDGNQREQRERGDVVWVGNRECLDRRQEEEVVAKRGGKAGKQ